jgi:hypothetical protein
LSFTDILIARAEHDFLVDAEYVAAREAIRPAATRKVAQRRGLRVRRVLVTLGSISGVESNLEKKTSYRTAAPSCPARPT